jgi:hypothetical protein
MSGRAASVEADFELFQAKDPASHGGQSGFAKPCRDETPRHFRQPCFGTVAGRQIRTSRFARDSNKPVTTLIYKDNFRRLDRRLNQSVRFLIQCLHRLNQNLHDLIQDARRLNRDLQTLIQNVQRLNQHLHGPIQNIRMLNRQLS